MLASQSSHADRELRGFESHLLGSGGGRCFSYVRAVSRAPTIGGKLGANPIVYRPGEVGTRDECLVG